MIAANPYLPHLIASDLTTTQKIQSFAMRKGLHSHDAQDIAQEAIVRFLQYAKAHPERVQGEQTLVSIAKKCILNEYRRRKQKCFATTACLDLNLVSRPDRCECQELPTRQEIEHQLIGFRPQVREIAKRYVIDRHSVEEIGASLCMTKGAVRNCLYSLRKRLQADDLSLQL